MEKMNLHRSNQNLLADTEDFNALREAASQTTYADQLRQTEEKVMGQTIPWEGYQRANLITDKEQELIKNYDKKSPEARVGIFQKEGDVYAELFLNLLVKINKAETLKYLLTLIEQIFRDYPPAIQHFLRLSTETNSTYPYEPALRILSRSGGDWYTNAKASFILASLMGKSNHVDADSIKTFCNWLRDNLKKNDEKEVNNAVAASMKFLNNEKYRSIFAAEDTLASLSSLLKTKTKNMQLLYQVIFCLWLLSFNPKVALQISETKLVPNLVEIFRLSLNFREKVTRVAVATLKNLLDVGNNNEQMITYGIVKPLENATAKNWADEDIKADLAVINQRLEKDIAHLSGFDFYKQEVMSGNLSWSTVHKSEKFWRENAHHLEENQHHLLLVLKELLSSSNPTVQAIACYDIGEFARFHPRGKIIIQQLGLKIPLMTLMEDKDAEVKKNALLAVQKLMVTNWEYIAAESK
ncbi:hypothetical protein PROFUN_07933 [Planoprotostelium fungivorum]|uniref:V-type proton ATPase subunit H n=1 Tax=Planoprotostelium fungivorum TaxID=1890364 RepID=A0A2P6NL61_9EUKA|nr:hypothetical protein PROFUN_07933 [Planoprotostelium fungivorum]